MTRGRKKDHTLPESRTLAAQRSYRDRKAKYVADLEDRCAAAEAEVVRLREELVEARRAQGSTSVLATHEAQRLLQGCSEMLGHLSSTQQALTLFQHRLMSADETSPSSNLSQSTAQPSNLDLLINAVLSQTQQSDIATQGNTRTLQIVDHLVQPGGSHSARDADAQSVSESECCGGFIDCSQLSSETMIT